MENKIEIVRRHYGVPVYGIHYDNGQDGGYTELTVGTVPTFDTVLSAILDKEWSLQRRMNLADMQRYRPDDVETIKTANAYAFDFGIAVDTAKALMSHFTPPD